MIAEGYIAEQITFWIGVTPRTVMQVYAHIFEASLTLVAAPIGSALAASAEAGDAISSRAPLLPNPRSESLWSARSIGERMKAVRVDEAGELRCWNCGGTSFQAKRTLRAKVTTGIGALVTKKKLRCNVCGKYNMPGDAQLFTGPEDPEHRRRWREQKRGERMQRGSLAVSPHAAVPDHEYADGDEAERNVWQVPEDERPQVLSPPPHLVEDSEE